MAEPTLFTVIRHGEKVTDRFGIQASGGTPLGPALWWVLQTLSGLREERKIVLVLTDGIPDAVQPCRYALHQAQRLGMEVYGVGILNDAITALLPQTSCVIRNLSDLAPAMFGLLQKAMLKGGRP